MATLTVPAAARADLELFAKWFTLTDFTGDADAERVAGRLEGVVMSSDTDYPYVPCVLRSEDPRSDGFFAELGVGREERQSVGGYDNPKLEVVTDGPPMALITRLGEFELGRIDDYVSKGDQEAIGAALTDLASLGALVGVQLCADDGATKLVLTLAVRPGAAVGVATLRVET